MRVPGAEPWVLSVRATSAAASELSPQRSKEQVFLTAGPSLHSLHVLICLLQDNTLGVPSQCRAQSSNSHLCANTFT